MCVFILYTFRRFLFFASGNPRLLTIKIKTEQNIHKMKLFKRQQKHKEIHAENCNNIIYTPPANARSCLPPKAK